MTDTLDSLFAEAKARFLKAHIGEAAFDARLLICGLLDLSAAAFMTRGSEAVAPEDARRIRTAIARRAAHEPVHRILGSREFFGLTLGMSKDTLEPRPDSEMIVEGLIPFARKILAEKGSCRIIDLGTGTGAICLALLSAVPEATGVGSDLAAGAVEMARANARRNTLDDRFVAVESDWFERIEGAFDIIVSNPPYIRTDVVASLAPEVRDHDPALALDGGADGLDAYRIIAANAAGHLAEGGIVGVEIGYDQLQVVGHVFEENGFRIIDRIRDLGGNDRAIVFSFGNMTAGSFRKHEERAWNSTASGLGSKPRTGQKVIDQRFVPVRPSRRDCSHKRVAKVRQCLVRVPVNLTLTKRRRRQEAVGSRRVPA